MTNLEIILIVIASSLVMSGLIGLAIYLTRRQNQDDLNNTNPCHGPLPVPNSNIHIPEQNIPLTAWLNMCNRRRMPVWGWFMIGLLFVLTVVFLSLFTLGNQTSATNTEKPEAVTTINTPVPAPLPVPQFPNDYAKKADVDSATAKITGAISQHDKNLTDHRQSSGRGYAAAKKQREEILTVVNANGGKLDNISKQVADLDASITLLRGELIIMVDELKTALADSSTTQKINSLTDEINQLRLRIETLEKQKNNLVGDPD
ncbi:hypothetical protein KKC17_04420 [Patescibacteria group bacterium]|nr:hypothetical protein [Patescibacteria group bacterium]